MSSKAGKMEKQVLAAQMPEQKTKDMTIRINVNIAGIGEKCTYMLITGVPEDLPKEYESTVIKTAEGQFAQAINQRQFMEFYNPCKTSKDEQPVFINLTQVSWLEIKNVEKVEQ